MDRHKGTVPHLYSRQAGQGRKKAKKSIRNTLPGIARQPRSRNQDFQKSRCRQRAHYGEVIQMAVCMECTRQECPRAAPMTDPNPVSPLRPAQAPASWQHSCLNTGQCTMSDKLKHGNIFTGRLVRKSLWRSIARADSASPVWQPFVLWGSVEQGRDKTVKLGMQQ